MSYLIYRGSPLGGLIQKAESVTFDNTGTGLSATNVQDAIEEIGPKTLATVTSDGVKTYAQIFGLLKTAFQGLTNAERFRCMLVFESGVYYCAQYSDNPAFGNTETSGGNMYAQSVEFKSTGATYTYVEIRPDRSVVFVDASSYIPTSGKAYSLILA